MAQGPLQVREFAGAPYLSLATDTLLRTTPSYVSRIAVNIAGTASGVGSAGAIYDTNTAGTAGTAAAHLAFLVPNTAGVYAVYWPCATGVRVVPAAGATLAVTLA